MNDTETKEIVELPAWLDDLAHEILELIEATYPLGWTVREGEVQGKHTWRIHVWPELGLKQDGTRVWEGLSLDLGPVIDLLETTAIICHPDMVLVETILEDHDVLLVLAVHHMPPGGMLLPPPPDTWSIPPAYRVLDETTGLWERLTPDPSLPTPLN